MKKIFAFVLTLIMVACMFTGCGETQPETAYDSEKDAVVEVTIADLTQVPGYDYLYYNTINRTVYYLFDQRGYKRASGFMAKYISNGHMCEYVNGQLVEVMDGEIVGVVSLRDLENNTDVVIADLAAITGYDYLYYSLNTHTVYYFFTTSGYETRMGFMETYTSNSYYCEYVNGQIIEVIPAQITN